MPRESIETMPAAAVSRMAFSVSASMLALPFSGTVRGVSFVSGGGWLICPSVVDCFAAGAELQRRAPHRSANRRIAALRLPLLPPSDVHRTHASVYRK